MSSRRDAAHAFSGHTSSNGATPWSSLNGGALVRHVAAHPSALVTLAEAGWRLRATGWWRRPPFLPRPSAPYWDFRLATVNGREQRAFNTREVLDVARWSAKQRIGR